MRYDFNHKQRTRRRIVEAAARRFRESGYRAAGVDQVMKEAGLTAGGFYAHFPSKEALLAEILGLSLEQVRSQLLEGLEGLSDEEWMRMVVKRYLSRAHRDQPGAGCPLPTLGGEIAREGAEPRLALQTYLQQIVAELAPRTPAAPGLEPEDRLLATVSLLAGAMMLARAVPDPELSDRILQAARRLAVGEAPHPLAPSPIPSHQPGEGERPRTSPGEVAATEDCALASPLSRRRGGDGRGAGGEGPAKPAPSNAFPRRQP